MILNEQINNKVLDPVTHNHSNLSFMWEINTLLGLNESISFAKINDYTEQIYMYIETIA